MIAAFVPASHMDAALIFLYSVATFWTLLRICFEPQIDRFVTSFFILPQLNLLAIRRLVLLLRALNAEFITALALNILAFPHRGQLNVKIAAGVRAALHIHVGVGKLASVPLEVPRAVWEFRLIFHKVHEP